MINYEMQAQSLLDKHGFYGGDQLYEEVEIYYNECLKNNVEPERCMISKTLCEVVKTYLIPSIPFDVEYVELTTMHNPIRLVKFDGEEIKDYELIREVLEGETVTVTSDQVQEIIKRIIS